MKLFKNIVWVVLIFSSVVVFAQDKKEIKKADELYSNYSYVEAIKIYQRIMDQGYVNQDILQKLGDSYFFKADYAAALKPYEILFQKLNSGEYKKVDAEYYYRYAQCLKSAERYTESNEIMDKFVSLVGKKDPLANLYDKKKDYLAEIKRNSGRVEVKTTQVNTKYSEYGPAFYQGGIVFTANRKPSVFGLRSEWTGEGMYNIYIAEGKNEEISGDKKMSSAINTKLNESTAVFTKDGKTMYFTRNNPPKNLKTRDKTILLKLYRAERDDKGNWVNVKELPFTSNVYSTAHPALSPDEKYLYFASNMPGTLGESDIFRVEIKSDGTFGKPENLGDKINTKSRETFPFVTSDNVLYYASDGFPGLGGLDIFAAQIGKDGKLSDNQNVGRALNSPYDDFALILDPKENIGYFSSNRPGGKGSDDIYFFKQNRPLVFGCFKKLRGVVKDALTKEVIADAKVVVSDRTYDETFGTTNTQKDGTFLFSDDMSIPCDEGYVHLKAEKEEYEAVEDKVVLSDEEETFHEILLTPSKRKIEVGTNLADVFGIKDIYFDFDKSNIRPDAAVQLSQIVAVMKDHPTMVIEVKSHTDSRGSASYNRALSDRRVKSTIKWIVSQGIAADRIFGKGYGEDQLVNKCSDGVPCTEAEHQANRRSEFIIVKM